MNRLKWIFGLALLVKLALTAVLPLTNDEAYYWVWSHHMQLSFYDHPPVVAWLFWLGQPFELVASLVRWPAVLLGHLTLALWLILLKPYFTDPQREWWLWLALLSPLVGGTNLLVTPDLPLLFFYALSLLSYFRWRDRSDRISSVAFGLCVGLGFSAKYMMVLFVLSAVPVVFGHQDQRRNLINSIGWLSLGFLVGAAPVWLWNLSNNFASFRFQVDHGLGRHVWKPSWTYEYVLAQIGLMFPPVLYWALRERKSLPAIFFWMATMPPVFFLFTTARGYAEANWPIAAYPVIFALALGAWPKNKLSLGITVAVWGTLLAALFSVVVVQPDWAKPLKFREFHQFETLERASQALQPLFARSYQMAAKMNFDMKRPVYKLRGMNRHDFYDELPGSLPPVGDFYLAVEKGDTLPKEFTDQGLRRLEVRPVDESFEIWRVGLP